MNPFVFLNPGDLRDGDLRLVLKETAPPDAGRAAAYRFSMRRLPDGAKLGRIELRLGMSEDLIFYTGHIGYCVEPGFRGHRYAARSCRLLLELARRHEMPEIWITCDPDNLASYRTCELAGGEFVSTVPVPESHPFYQAGSTAKCRFRFRP